MLSNEERGWILDSIEERFRDIREQTQIALDHYQELVTKDIMNMVNRMEMEKENPPKLRVIKGGY